MCSIHPRLPHLHKWHHNPLSCSKVGVLLNFLTVPYLSYQIHHQVLSSLPSKYTCQFFPFPFLSCLFKPLSLLLDYFNIFPTCSPTSAFVLNSHDIFSTYQPEWSSHIINQIKSFSYLKPTNWWFLIRLKTKPPKNLNFLTCQQSPVWSDLSESSKELILFTSILYEWFSCPFLIQWPWILFTSLQWSICMALSWLQVMVVHCLLWAS